MERHLEARPVSKNRTLNRAEIGVRSEAAFVALVILVVLLLTSLPYLFAYLTSPVDKQYMGLMLDVPDHGQYFSWMRELTDSHLSANKLTPEANRPVFFNLLWWGLGRLGATLGLGFAGVFQILRFGSAVLFLLLAYRMIAYFLHERLQRQTALLVVTFTSGFGWVLIVIKYLLRLEEVPFPLDVYVAEGNTFLSILGYPHFIAAALYIFVFDLVLRGEARGKLWYAVAAGLVAMFFGWQHAYDLVLVWGILAAYAGLKLLRDRRIPMYLVWAGLIIGLISVWPAIYSVLLTSLDPVWEEVLGQFANAGVFTPGLLHLPILLGISFLLAIYTVIRRNPLHLERWDDRNLFLLAWFGANFLLIYIPTDFQIHMLNGWQVPISILAVQGLFAYLLPWARKRLGRPNLAPGLLAAVFILAILPTNLYLLTWRFIELSRYDYPYFLHQSELDAMGWLDANGSEDEVVISSLTVGQYLPALTGKHAFLAHWAQTLDFFGKQRMVDQFFDPEFTDGERLAILSRYRVDYVFYGPAERQLGELPLDVAPYLSLVYDNEGVQVFVVDSMVEK